MVVACDAMEDLWPSRTAAHSDCEYSPCPVILFNARVMACFAERVAVPESSATLGYSAICLAADTMHDSVLARAIGSLVMYFII